MAARDWLTKSFSLPFRPAAGEQAVYYDAYYAYEDTQDYECDDGLFAQRGNGLSLVLGNGEGRGVRLLREGRHCELLFAGCWATCASCLLIGLGFKRVCVSEIGRRPASDRCWVGCVGSS